MKRIHVTIETDLFYEGEEVDVAETLRAVLKAFGRPSDVEVEVVDR